MEVDQQAYPFARETKTRKQLCIVAWSQLVYCFDLYHYRVFYHQVESVSAVQLDVSVDHRPGFLLFESNATLSKFVCQADLVRRLQKTRSQPSMHLDGRSDDAARNRIEPVFLSSSAISAYSAVKSSMDTAGITFSGMGSFRARVRGRRSRLPRAQYPCRSRRAARCQTCAGRGTT